MIRAIIAVVCVLMSAIWALPRNADAQTIGDVAKAWSERQNGVKTAEFWWSSTIVNSIPNHGEPYSFDAEGTHLAIKGRSIRYDSVILNPSPDSRRPYASAWDEKLNTSLVGTLGTGFPQGIVRDGPSYNDVDNIVFRPILLTFRGCEPSLRGIDLTTMEVVTVNADTDGIQCWHLRETRPRDPGLQRSMWLDPLRDFLVVRYAHEVAGTPSSQVDIDYGTDSSGVPVPISWTAVLLGANGAIMQSYAIQVRDFKVNHDVDSSQFRIAFPVGAWVDDRQQGVQYLVRRDGHRLITPAELRRGVSYEELLSTDSGEAGLPLRSWLTIRMFVAVGVVVLAVVIALRHIRA